VLFHGAEICKHLSIGGEVGLAVKWFCGAALKNVILTSGSSKAQAYTTTSL